MNIEFRKTWKPRSNENCKLILDPQKSIISTEHLQILQCIYAGFLNKHFQICLYLFKIKLNNNFSNNNKTLRSWVKPALLGLIQSYSIAHIIQLHCKIGGAMWRFKIFLSNSLVGTMSINSYQIIIYFQLLPDWNKVRL